ncbi:hypothetical protein LJR098_003350 [Rhizobium sp. LjRoot98]|uniref:hypothetical protein n=1 Tax=Rhizobium sp. LjRoot98 TaxID=3342345 RepID=UPI003ECCFEE9
MRKLPLPIFDDVAAIEAAAQQRRLGSFPLLRGHVAAIRSGYTQYEGAGGNAEAVAHVAIPDALASWLRKHYKKPPKVLDEITKMRERYIALPCSMCGSFHSSSLDHVFPKENHPAFAVFTRNLVPACDCNLKKGVTLRGNTAGARILHPYYDACLDERLFSAKIRDPGPTIDLDIEIILDVGHEHFLPVEFHLNAIVKKTGILNWMGDQWTKLLRHPPSIIGTFNFIPATEQSLVDALNVQLGYRDRAHSSPNNWESMFVHGLLDPVVTAWLFARATEAGRTDPEAPLIQLAVA